MGVGVSISVFDVNKSTEIDLPALYLHINEGYVIFVLEHEVDNKILSAFDLESGIKVPYKAEFFSRCPPGFEITLKQL